MTSPAAEQEFIVQPSDEEHRYEPEAVDESESGDDFYPIDEYDVVISANDFNTKTLISYIDSGAIVIPGFQRNYVWDVKKASRLVESIIVGLPIPQIFLYEQARNKDMVIDGQQRLMSIYYFVKERFPRKEKLVDLRLKYEGQSAIPADTLADDEYFTDFRLNLPEKVPGRSNKFHRRIYSSLDDEHQSAFDLRTIRSIRVRQIQPVGDEAMYEIFNRLNSGGEILTPQEIRRCMFDSKFYDMLYRTNTNAKWRKLVGTRTPDVHMKDVEILLRGFAMLVQGDSYHSSMVKFLNSFSENARGFGTNELNRLQSLLDSFLETCSDLPPDAFHSTQGRFSPMIFESVFVATCQRAYDGNEEITGKIDVGSLNRLKDDQMFRNATQSRTSAPANVKTRLSRAFEILELV